MNLLITEGRPDQGARTWMAVKGSIDALFLLSRVLDSLVFVR